MHAPERVLGAGRAIAFTPSRGELMLISETRNFGWARTPAISSSVKRRADGNRWPLMEGGLQQSNDHV
jgi:hypothetical protein